MSWGVQRRRVPLAVYARAIDEAAARLRDLRREVFADIALGALALGLSIAATQFNPSLALPLFIGGLAVGALGVRAAWRRWDLVDRLAGDSDAYVIPEVLAHASWEATLERRHTFAALIRSRLSESVPANVRVASDELEALALELDDAELALDPASAVACVRLLSEFADSPLLNPALPPESLRSRVRQIRAGFSPGRLAA